MAITKQNLFYERNTMTEENATPTEPTIEEIAERLVDDSRVNTVRELQKELLTMAIVSYASMFSPEDQVPSPEEFAAMVTGSIQGEGCVLDDFMVACNAIDEERKTRKIAIEVTINVSVDGDIDTAELAEIITAKLGSMPEIQEAVANATAPVAMETPEAVEVEVDAPEGVEVAVVVEAGDTIVPQCPPEACGGCASQDGCADSL